MAIAVGIDLGTTNTVVATVRDGVAATVPDPQGNRLIPSVVSFHPAGSTLVGHPALERRLIDPPNTIFSVKRLMGRPWASPEVQQARTKLPFAIGEGATGGTMVTARGESYSLPEISAFVLRQAKAIAEAALGEPVPRAVITVPANFNDLQRAATKTAGRIAGLEVLRILNEPTAAALAYGPAERGPERIAVFDLGGGTFDVTLLELAGNVFEVLATAGDTALGGDDIDVVVAERMADELLARFRFDARAHGFAFGQLRILAEQVKRELSIREEHEIAGDDVVPGDRGKTVAWRFRMNRTELERASLPLVERTFGVCQQALDAARVKANELDRVILVGGATRMPLVARMVEQFFGRPPVVRINPDEVVALGAAIQASLLDRTKRRRSEPMAHPLISQDSVVQPLPSNDSSEGERVPLPIVRVGGPTTAIAGWAPPSFAPLSPAGESRAPPGIPRASRAAPAPARESRAAPAPGGEPRAAPVGPRASRAAPAARQTLIGHAPREPPRGAPVPREMPGKADPRDVAGTSRAAAAPPAVVDEPPIVFEDPGIVIDEPRIVIDEPRIIDDEPVVQDAPYFPAATSRPLVFDVPSTSPSPAQKNGSAPGVVPSRAATMMFGSAGAPVAASATRPASASGAVSVPAPVASAPLPPMRPRAPTMPFPFEAAAGALPATEPAAPPPPLASVAPPAPLAPPSLPAARIPERAAPRRPAPLLIDVTPLSLSVETVGGFCDVLIDANTPVPCDRTRSFATASAGQTSVRVRVAQGPSKRFDENTCLGEVELSGLTAAPRGETKIAVTFEIDADGILHVRARNLATGHEAAARLQLHGGQSADDEIAEMMARQAERPIG